jgi:hypothetical protein
MHACVITLIIFSVHAIACNPQWVATRYMSCILPGAYEPPKERATIRYARVPSKYKFMQNTFHIWKPCVYLVHTHTRSYIAMPSSMRGFVFRWHASYMFLRRLIICSWSYKGSQWGIIINFKMHCGSLPYTIKVHFSACEKIMRICQNGPLEIFLQTLHALQTYVWRDNIYAIQIYATAAWLA